MFVRQLIDPDLGCVSYVIADAGKGIVVDPFAAIDQYLELACRHDSGSRTSSRPLRSPCSVSGSRALVELTVCDAAGARPGASPRRRALTKITA